MPICRAIVLERCDRSSESRKAKTGSPSAAEGVEDMGGAAEAPGGLVVRAIDMDIRCASFQDVWLYRGIQWNGPSTRDLDAG